MLKNFSQYMLCPSNSYFTPTQVLRPDGYQQLLMRLAELCRDVSPFNNPRLIADDHVSWVLLTLSVRIHRQISPCEDLTAQCWNTWHKGILTRRDARFWDAEEKLVISAASFHTLIDFHTRKICREHTAYEAAAQKCGPELFEAGSRIPFHPGSGTCVAERTVLPSWLDILGHVNNTRYGEVIYDCMTPVQQNQLKSLVSMDIYFLHELRCGERFAVYVQEENNFLDISALKLPEEQSAFGARLCFTKT